jgi:hypothetical protein
MRDIRAKRVRSAPLLLALLVVLMNSALILSSSTPSAVSLTSKTTLDDSVKSESKKKQQEKKAKKAKKAKQEKKARLNPQISPAPNWPPKGFTQSNGIYAKIPGKKELAGILSARSALFEAIKPCDEVACGSVIVASAEKCLWWEVLSTVTGPKMSDSATITSYGSLTTKISGSDARKQKVILLISEEPVGDRIRVSNINVTCHRSGKKGKSGNTYLPFEDRG